MFRKRIAFSSFHLFLTYNKKTGEEPDDYIRSTPASISCLDISRSMGSLLGSFY